MHAQADVALILWNADVIDLASIVLERWRLKSIGVEPSATTEAIEDLIARGGPRVIVFDLRPPYEFSAGIASHLLEVFSDLAFVFTCADAAQAQKKAAWLRRYPILQKPYQPDEMGQIVSAMISRGRVAEARRKVAAGPR